MSECAPSRSAVYWMEVCCVVLGCVVCYCVGVPGVFYDTYYCKTIEKDSYLNYNF